jgi:YVTN family beta-propeller protein
MKLGAFVGIAAITAMALVGGVGCGQQSPGPSASSGIPTPANDVYSVVLTANTPSALPKCTSAIAGSVAFVSSPASLWACDGSGWGRIECDGDEAGKVAYASSTQQLWACVPGGWTQVALPQGPKGPQGDAGPPGPQGPQGPQGDAGAIGATGPQGSMGAQGPQGIAGEGGATGAQGATGPAGADGGNGLNSLILVTSVAAGPSSPCPSGGEMIQVGLDANGDGILESTEVQNTAYVCNGAAGSGSDASSGATQDARMDVTIVDVVDAAVDVARPPSCTTTAVGSTRGSAIALTPDETRLVAVNRDVGTVTVMTIDYLNNAQPTLTKLVELSIGSGAGSLPSQVAIDACGKRAFVVLRGDQQVVAIENLDSTPTVGASVAVGSEPTSLALTPNGTAIYVANWVDGTVTVIDPVAMQQTATIDLNGPLVSTGTLGSAAVARPAVAHPRAIAITNNGDTSDSDETVVVTEWYAARIAPEGSSVVPDTTHEGLIYKVSVASGAVTMAGLPPVTDTGFVDTQNQHTGCYPNQLAAVTIDQGLAYVTSTCASPAGPLGVFRKNPCVINQDCKAGATCVGGACTGTCTKDSDCSPAAPSGTCNTSNGTCGPETANVMTTTHPAVSVVPLSGTGNPTTVVLDKLAVAASSTRMPLLPTDIGFAQGFAYVTAEGADAVFRLTVTSGSITGVGTSTTPFIDLHESSTDTLIRLPMGIALGRSSSFAYIEDEGARDVTAISLGTQTIAGDGISDFRITSASALPAAGSLAASQLAGKRDFNTGLGRWSLNGSAWGSCGACHVDGLSDNVTWYFDRGPRQSVSLDGTFNKSDTTDQRILDWTASFDEIADFEVNVRNVSGGVGAIVSTVSSPPVVSDRIDVGGQTPPQEGLEGSSDDTANPSGTGGPPHSVDGSWVDIRHYIQTIRSPARPTTLDPSDVTAGKALFLTGNGNCVGCHSGAKWTISKVFYTPGDTPNAAYGSTSTSALRNIAWGTNLNGFPALLLPDTDTSARKMVEGLPETLEQVDCVLRPVGTFGTSDAAVNVQEQRDDQTSAQGNGSTTAGGVIGKGYNPPSLLGLQAGAPYFHAGNARTLEEALSSSLFQTHLQSSIAQTFSPSATQVRQLVAYLLSIDANESPFAEPALGVLGGDLCHYP